MKQKGRHTHPHHAIAEDLTKSIKTKMKENYEIAVTIDNNESFTLAKGGIDRLCCKCKLFDPHRELIEGPSYIRGSKRIYFIFVIHDLLNFIESDGSTAFKEYTTSD